MLLRYSSLEIVWAYWRISSGTSRIYLLISAFLWNKAIYNFNLQVTETCLEHSKAHHVPDSNAGVIEASSSAAFMDESLCKLTKSLCDFAKSSRDLSELARSPLDFSELESSWSWIIKNMHLRLVGYDTKCTAAREGILVGSGFGLNIKVTFFEGRIRKGFRRSDPDPVKTPTDPQP